MRDWIVPDETDRTRDVPGERSLLRGTLILEVGTGIWPPALQEDGDSCPTDLTLSTFHPNILRTPDGFYTTPLCVRNC